MKVLITGFNPFGSHQLNPAQGIVEILKETNWNPEFLFEILETSYGKSESRLRELIRLHQPERVVLLGLAQTRASVTLERFALNVDDCSLADNCGDLRLGLEIVADGPAAYPCGLSLESIRDAMNARRLPVEISNHAGTFVCNHVYYIVSDLLRRELPGAACVFVHVPVPRDKPFKGSISQHTLDSLVRTIDALINGIANGDGV